MQFLIGEYRPTTREANLRCSPNTIARARLGAQGLVLIGGLVQRLGPRRQAYVRSLSEHTLTYRRDSAWGETFLEWKHSAVWQS